MYKRQTLDSVISIVEEMIRVSNMVIVEYLESDEPIISKIKEKGVLDWSFKRGMIEFLFSDNGFNKQDYILIDPYIDEFKECDRVVALFSSSNQPTK